MTSSVSGKRIVVVGTGYVGFPAALFLARAGATVVGVDLNTAVVDAINAGRIPVREEALQDIMDEPGIRERLTAQSTPCPADVFLIAVPTPVHHRKKSADLGAVIAATSSIVPHLRPGNLVILESTVPPLTCREVMTPLLEQSGLRVGENLFLAHCPERIFPGRVCYELVHNDRIIGAADPVSRQLACDLYASFVVGTLLETDDLTAELCKLMENAYRDVNIAFANELASVAENLGVDPYHAIELANRHPRVNILTPGIGVGGHCIPVDPWFIREVDPANSMMILASRMVNDSMPGRVAAKIRRAVRDIDHPRIIALGATYKPNTEDIRESPALQIVDLLREDGYQIEHYDPLVKDYRYDGSLAELAHDADLLAVLTKHDVLAAELDADRAAILAGMRHPRILEFWDTRESARL